MTAHTAALHPASDPSGSVDHRLLTRERTSMPPNGEPIIRWIADSTTRSDDGLGLLNGLCAALCEQRVPLWRVSMILPALNPSIRALRFDWSRDHGAVLFSAAHDDPGAAGPVGHPVHALLSEGRTFARWRLDDRIDNADLPALVELRNEGGTDFVQYIIWFTPGTALKGFSMSFASDRAGGFSDADLALLADVLPTLGLAMSKLSLSRTLRETLAIYLGSATAARVLAGNIQRGRGETVAAAILLADFRAFTALTEREDSVNVVAWLDEHLDAVGEAVTRGGGEILKFTGDGFLAIFAVPDAAGGPGATCDAALGAAEKAQRANAALNARRRAAGLPQLDVDLALHFGEVVYGNVGTSRRLDFTVIGRAVNEASRIEELCDTTGHALLVSDSFAERCARPLQTIGTFTLRGLERQQRIWTTA